MRHLALLLVAACSTSSDVVGPFTGAVSRFVVDRIDVAADATGAEAVAADLDGDGKPDNKFGYATAVLAATNDLSPNAGDMIASGALASVVEIQADDLLDDDTVGVRYLGGPGDRAVAVGGRMADAAFTPNRVRDTDHPGTAIVRMPVFVNADPVALAIDRLEIELAPDGANGFEAIIRGGMDERAAREAARAGLVQMFETEPMRHLVFLRGVDEDHDDMVSYAELESSVIGLLVAADVHLAGRDLVSIAFRVHLSPCPADRCSTAPPQNTCRDRIVDAGELDVDCGGPCQPCADHRTCAVPAGCQSNVCVTMTCGDASCGDGVRDAFESDVDCGGHCAACGPGNACAADRDCASNNCSNGPASLGICN